MKEGYFADVARCFRGTAAWVNWIVLAYGFVAFGLIIHMAIGLYDADTTRNQILYATGLILSAILFAMVKLFVFIQMSRRWLAERLDEMEKS